MQALLFNKTVYYYKQMNNSKQILAEEPDVIPYLQYRKYIFNEDKTMALYVCYKRNYKKQKIDFHTYTLDTIYYDASGNEIERISYTSDGEFHNRSLMQYDEQNNMVRKELYDRPLASDPKTVFTYAYEYDEYGNWTSAKSNNEDGSLCDYTLREIEYY
jgi:hypothetical protein